MSAKRRNVPSYSKPGSPILRDVSDFDSQNDCNDDCFSRKTAKNCAAVKGSSSCCTHSIAAMPLWTLRPSLETKWHTSWNQHWNRCWCWSWTEALCTAAQRLEDWCPMSNLTCHQSNTGRCLFCRTCSKTLHPTNQHKQVFTTITQY